VLFAEAGEIQGKRVS